MLQNMADKKSGYWIPFEAAKAVAATFCWKIRYALTPIFGVDFLDMCVPENDRENFGRMIIDRSIIERVTVMAEKYRQLEPPVTRPRGGQSSANIPKQQLRSKRGSRVEEVDSYYGMESDGSEKDCSYHTLAPRTSGWTPANVPRPRTRTSPRPTLPSPREILASISAGQATFDFGFGPPRRTRRKQHMMGGSFSHVNCASNNSIPHSTRVLDIDDESDLDDEDIVRARSDREEDTDLETAPSEADNSADVDVEMTDANDDECNRDVPNDTAEDNNRHSPLPLTNDARAAYMLMRLHMREMIAQEKGGAEEGGEEKHRDEGVRKRRRASA